ncbi:MAG: PIN domain-containing protein [Planctomycetota bacterium]
MSISTTTPPNPSESSLRTGTLFMIVLRVVFVLALSAVGMSFVSDEHVPGQPDLIMIGFVGAAFVVIALDIFVPRKSLAAISGLFFGLIVGMVIAYGLSLIIDLLASTNAPGGFSRSQESFLTALKLAIGVTCCYLSVSFILQTKDDVRFVIPYVEFAKEMKGAKPFVLDTSVIVDGRIADISNTKIITSELVVPRFVLQELQTIADSSDKLKRVRGRRGLDMLNKLQSNENIEIRMLDVVPERSAANAGVDEMLVDLCVQLSGKIMTNDYNLNKIAQLRGVPVININDLANALKPVVLPGETMSVKVVKPGEEVGQGIGYLEDGTMVVAEGARDRLGETVELTVTSVLQTSAGRMIFGRMDGVAPPDRRRFRPPDRPQQS